VQRGNDRHRTFFDEEDFRTYLLLLDRISQRYSTSIHAYALMSNHVHLLMTSRLDGGISRTMQQTGSSYVRYVNRRLQRTGTLWESRFRSSPVTTDYYCLACYRYIELNPVRAGMVAHPADYHWSSYWENTGRRGSTFVTPHPSFLALATTPTQARARYAELVEAGVDPGTLADIRQCTASGSALGRKPLAEDQAREDGIDRRIRRRGRPRKSTVRSTIAPLEKGL
jgi:putative transposase